MTLTVEIRDVTFGTGTDYGVSVEGTNWRAAPDLRSRPLPRSGRHGLLGGRDLLGGRRVPITVLIEEATMADAMTAERTVAAAFATTEVAIPLTITDDSGTWVMYGHPEPAAPDLSHADVGLITVECRFTATDPLLYGPEQSSTTGFPAGGVGHTFPLLFPWVFGAAGSGGSLTITNDGTADAPWQAEIVGPWVNPTITHVGSGDVLSLSVSVAAGEALLLDSADESVLLGSAHRLNAVLPGSVWPVLAPGANELRFGGASGTGSSTAIWRSAWW